MMTELPEPPDDDLSQQYWDALDAGRLEFQRCRDCGHAWLPPREECPGCWSGAWDREPSSGRGRLISWIVYHKAYHPYFEDRLPYNVAIVELAEGPRLLTNILEDDGLPLQIDHPVDLVIEREGGRALARFRLADPTVGTVAPQG